MKSILAVASAILFSSLLHAENENSQGPTMVIDGMVKSFDSKTVVVELAGGKVLRLDRRAVHGKLTTLKKSHLEIAAWDWDKVDLN